MSELGLGLGSSFCLFPCSVNMGLVVSARSRWGSQVAQASLEDAGWGMGGAVPVLSAVPAVSVLPGRGCRLAFPLAAAWGRGRAGGEQEGPEGINSMYNVLLLGERRTNANMI